MALFDNTTAGFDNSSSLNVLEHMQITENAGFTIKYYLLFTRICFIHPLGIIGSILILLIFPRTTFGSKTFKFSILVIAVADGLRLFNASISLIAQLIMWSKPVWFCRLSFFMSYFLSSLSDVNLVIVAIERAFAVAIPHKVKLIFTMKRKYFTFLTVFTLNTLINIPIIFVIGTNQSGGCTFILKYMYISKVFIIFIMVYFLICFMIVLICAIIIMYNLRQRSIQMPCVHADDSNNNMQLTFILLSIAIFYLINTVPILIFHFYTMFISTVKNTYVLLLLKQFAVVLKELGHIGNFYIYCWSSKMFRKIFIDLVLSCVAASWKCRNRA